MKNSTEPAEPPARSDHDHEGSVAEPQSAYGTRPTIGDPGSFGNLEGLPAMTADQRPDAMIDGGDVDHLRLRAASVRGLSHRSAGTPRQDDFNLSLAGTDPEWLIAAVADGVSSAPKSQHAARIATRVASESVRRQLVGDSQIEPLNADGIDWLAVLTAAAVSIVNGARKATGDQTLVAKGTADVMATTLAIAIIATTPNGSGTIGGRVVTWGDTAAMVLRADHTWVPASPLKGGDRDGPISSVTPALPYLPNEIHAVEVELFPGDVLILFTDGVGEALGDGKSALGRALTRWWATPPDRYLFAAQVDFVRASETDDRTAVAVWIREPEAAAGHAAEPDGLHAENPD